MKIEDYNEYYIQGSDHYLIPKDVFDELFDEMENWKEEAKELNKQIDELKKQVETYEIEGYEQNEELNKMSFDIRKYKVQQKEFMNFLTEAINKLKLEQETSNSAILKANTDLQMEVYSIVLSKYKEIIGVQMKKIKMTKKEYMERHKNNEISLRSCWNCNSAHKHLKKVDYLIYCMWCGNLYFKGKEVEIIGDDK